MDEFYTQCELSLNHLFGQGLAISYVYWDSHDLKQQQAIKMDEIAQAMPEMAQIIADGSMDAQLVELLKENFKVSKSKGKAMLRELRKDGETTVPITRQVINQPRIKALTPDEDVFFPSWTIDPQQAPYCFHVMKMTPEQLKAKVASEKWDEEWVDACIDSNARGADDTGNEWRLRDNLDTSGTDDQTIDVIYCYQRLLDEDDVPGIYCTVLCSSVPELYGKHALLDYGSGKYPFVVTKLEEVSKRMYSSRSYPELCESLQQVLKVETDALIDRTSLATLPPLEHPMGRAPAAWGPGVKVPYRTPGETHFADTPRFDPGSVEIRRFITLSADRYFGRNAAGVDPIEAQAKQQAIVDKVFGHLKQVLDQVYDLYQQYGPDEEYFRVTGVNDIQKFAKGAAGERFDFWLSFDVSSQDPAQMVERVKAIAELAGVLDRNGTLDTEKLLQVAVAQILPGASESIMLPTETASAKAMDEERQTIAEIYAGVPPNVKEGDAHEAKLQIFQQWLQQPDIAQKVQQDPALQERIDTYLKQRQMQIMQKQNAQIGKLGTMPTPYGQAASV
jgi:hypothetical protein